MSCENKSIDPLSVECMLTLTEQLSYDNKQLFIDKLNLPVFRVMLSCPTDFFVRSHNIDQVKIFLLTNETFIKNVDIHTINRRIIPKVNRCCCVFSVCNDCIVNKITCFVCNEILMDYYHFKSHAGNEISEDILKKYIDICNIYPCNVLN